MFFCSDSLAVFGWMSKKMVTSFMKFSQVIRGSDHIGNTARQIAVFKNMFLRLLGNGDGDAVPARTYRR